MDMFDVGFLLAGFAIAAMLVQRAVNAWREGNDLRFEFAAAQEIQRQLVTVAQKIPGFAIETVYAPAREVGGDFFRVLPGADGGVLLVVGDVSGKGLRAAMTVSSIMGALRTIPSQTPAVILDCLNRSLAGHLSSGFATCCAACISTKGRMTIANAGHLSPYRNGQEIQTDSGLPLGITAFAEYTEITLQLDPGDTLTFLSDGVVEAQNERRELFGFERTGAISSQSAENIARAAQHFGQEDDITVLTLTFAPAEVLHA